MNPQGPSIGKTVAVYGAISALSAIAGVAILLTYDAYRHPISWVSATQYLSGESLFVPDRELGFIVRPNLNAPSENPSRSYFTNDRSARVAAAGMATPARVDFITIGDSQTLGDGVASDDTFTGALARSTGLAGLNFGMSGYGSVGSLLLMRRVLDLKPKFVVYGFWEDHLNRNVRPCLESGMPFCTPRPVVAFDPLGPSIRLPDDPAAGLARARLWYGHGGPPFIKDLTAAAARNWNALLGLLSAGDAMGTVADSAKIEAAIFVLNQMKESAEASGARLVVVWLPLYFTEINDAPSWLSAFCRDAGIALVDMGPRLREFRRDGTVIAIPGNGHITADVHRAIAREIANSLVTP